MAGRVNGFWNPAAKNSFGAVKIAEKHGNVLGNDIARALQNRRTLNRNKNWEYVWEYWSWTFYRKVTVVVTQSGFINTAYVKTGNKVW